MALNKPIKKPKTLVLMIVDRQLNEHNINDVGEASGL